MKSRAPFVTLLLLLLMLLFSGAVLSRKLLSINIASGGRSLPATLALHPAKGTGPVAESIIDVRGQTHQPDLTVRPVPSDATNIAEETTGDIEPGQSFSGPVLSVLAPHCREYGEQVTARRRFPHPAIHDIVLAADGAVFTLHTGRFADIGTSSAETGTDGAENVDSEPGYNTPVTLSEELL